MSAHCDKGETDINGGTKMMTNLIPWKRGEGQPSGGGMQLAPVSTMRMDWDRLFDRFLDDTWGPFLGSSRGLLLDMSETDDEIRVRAEVPGMGPDDLDISLAGEVLTLSGQKTDEDESQDGARYYSERQFGSCQRAIKLPCPVDPDHVSAEHKNGVVTITLRKAETVRPKRIAIKTAQ
jgi:HSP20 family protein